MQEPATASARLRVGEFEVDLRCGEVRRNGDKIKLQQRPFQILSALLERPGEVVTREEIQQKLWPTDTFVDFEHSINTAVNKLREALGDDAENPCFIETLPRYGYRLISPVGIVETNGAFPEAEILSAPSPAPPSQQSPQENLPRKSPSQRRAVAAIAGVLVLLLVAGSLVLLIPFQWRYSIAPPRSTWVQITDFADSATSPALSPDGHMLAFIRGPDTFVTRGQIYVKMLPDGQPLQLTRDNRLKMAPAFSPDGSRIAYTTTEPTYGWNTWILPILGGEPERLLPNAAALTWVDRQRVMFSKSKTGNTMGLATATESRAGERDIYVPTSTVGMVHRSWLSPDGKWVLVSEMDAVGWLPCRVLPFDGSTSGERVGPKKARCTYAGWSPNGRMMYFSADAGDGYHIWRQHFPRGVPEQMTFGPTEEEGIAVSPDGRSLVTSAGIRASTVWVHDSRGDRQISGEGFARVPGLGFGGGADVRPVFSPDGKRVFYLVRTESSRAYTSGELWTADLDSGRSAAVLPGIAMNEFHLSPDGERVAFATQDAQSTSHVWVASLDRRSPPKQLTASASQGISFSSGGDFYFLEQEGDQEFLYSIGSNETVPRKVNSEPVVNLGGISPNGDWLLSGNDPVIARPLHGGSAIRVCKFCGIGWGPEGKLLYLRFRDVGEMGDGRTVVIGLPPGKDLPPLPPSGLKSIEDTKGLNVLAEIDTAGKVIFAPGPDPSVYAYSRLTVQRNLYRIPLK
jgi:DNA-binding winged helix-turn-helix (wHTH) protein/Tol biopolymer transport system component